MTRRRGSLMVWQMTSADEPPTMVETTVKAVLRAIPYVGSSLSTIFEDTRARHVARVAQVVEEVAMAAGADRLSEWLAKDEEVEVLFIEGVKIEIRSGLKAERRLLARVVAKAILDDAEIEPASSLARRSRISTRHTCGRLCAFGTQKKQPRRWTSTGRLTMLAANALQTQR